MRAARHAGGRASCQRGTHDARDAPASRCPSSSRASHVPRHARRAARSVTPAIDVIVCSAARLSAAGQRARLGLRRAALHAALGTQLGHRRLRRSRAASASWRPTPARRSSASTRCTPRTAAIRKPPARTRRPRAASSTGSPSTSTAVPEASDPDVQHYIASVGDELAALRAKTVRRLHRRRDGQGAGAAALLCRLERRARRRVRRLRSRAAARSLRRFAIHEALVARYGRNAAALAGRAAAPATRRGRGVRARGAARDRLLDVPAILRGRAARSGRRGGRARAASRSTATWPSASSPAAPKRGPARTTPDRQRRRAARPAQHAAARTGACRRSRRPRCERDAYAPFAGLLADNMRDAGALRIDHAMSLMRLFWIPRGGEAGRGRLRHAIRSTICSASSRARALRAHCMVIGEDLGTVPPGFREQHGREQHPLVPHPAVRTGRRRRVSSARGVSRAGAGRPPARTTFRRSPAGSTATTSRCTSGWACSTPKPRARRASSREVGDRAAARRAAARRRPRARSSRTPKRSCSRAYRYLARSPARIVMLQIEDALGERYAGERSGYESRVSELAAQTARRPRDDRDRRTVRTICARAAGVTAARMKVSSPRWRRMKGVLMAGGEGSRLRPLTSRRPKPLAPVAGKPVMEHIIALLRRHGITEIVATLHYLADEIESYFDDGADFGVTMEYVVEDTPLGTAGAVKMADELLGRRYVPRHLGRRADRHRSDRADRTPPARRATTSRSRCSA